MPDCGLGRRMLVRGIHVGTTLIAEALESSSEKISVAVQKVRAKLIDYDKNDELRRGRLEAGWFGRVRERLGRRTCGGLNHNGGDGCGNDGGS